MSGLDELKDFMAQDQAPPGAPIAAAQPTHGADQNLEALQSFMKPETNAETYGTLPQQAIAGLEGVARGATFGTSDLAESKLGISTPEAIRGRMEENPITSGAGSLVGGAGLIAATGGLGAIPEAGAGLAAKLAGGAALGGAFGAGTAVTDYALGDPNLNAQKIATQIGLGALLGVGAEGLGAGINSVLGKFGAVKGSVANAIGEAGGPATMAEPIVAGEGPVVDANISNKPSSIDSIMQRVADAKAAGETTELPQKALVLDAESRLPDLKHGLHDLQLESLDDQNKRDLYKEGLDEPTPIGDGLRDWETIQRNERDQALDKTIQSLSPNTENTSNLAEAGERVAQAFADNDAAQREALAPALNAIKSYETKDPFSHVPGVIEAFVKKVPGVARMIDTTGEELKINPYSTAWGIDRATYGAVKQAIEGLQEGPAFIKELMNVRNGLDQNVNMLQGGKAASQISGLKSGLLDYIQGEIEKIDPLIRGIRNGANEVDANAAHIRSTLKDWAIMEQQKEMIGKVFGAPIGSEEFGQISKRVPEKILGKIFSNTATVNAARNVLSPEQFGEAVSNLLAAAKESASTKGILSPDKFYSFLKKNQYVLDAALFDKAGAGQRIQDLNTTMRMLSEGPLNSSRTAKSLRGILKPNDIDELSIGSVLGKARAYFDEKLNSRMLNNKINQALGETAARQQKFDAVNKMTKEVDTKIQDGIDDILGKKK
jgi:hypothetical protein